jgi:hypothetical protein
MAENQRDNGGGSNRPGQDGNRGNDRGMGNNPSGETRGKNQAAYNPDSPTGQNIPGRDPERNNDPQRRSTPEVPNRKEEHETKIPRAEDESETYGDFDQNDSAASQ